MYECKRCVKCSGTIFSMCVRSGLVVAAIAAAAMSLMLFLGSPQIGPYLPWFIVALVALSLLAGLFTGVYEAKKITQQVRTLERQADDFASGNYSACFHVEGGPREMCELADSLNTITKGTRSALAELKAEEQRQRQFVSDVSHEIRTPLTGIRGNAETLLDPDMPPEVRETFCEIIIHECDRLKRLANDLLELQRLEETDIHLKRLDLRKLADEVCNTLAPMFESREIDVVVSGEAPDVLGDQDRLTQVLVNLLENATRFAKKRVDVKLSGVDGNSVISITDDGDGFGDVDPNRLFDRFYRGDKSRSSATGGTGLGLAIVKSIVNAHDGSIEAFNTSDAGACFAVGIPSINTPAA